jgi:monoamine oxidase
VRVDLGAAWHWEEHERVPPVLNAFGLDRIRQHEPGIAVFEPQRDAPVQPFEWPEEPPPSWRIAGGTQALAEAMAEALPEGFVRFHHRVSAIQGPAETPGDSEADGVTVSGEAPSGAFTLRAEACVCAIPPRLAMHTITFRPELPVGVRSALRRTPTWMSHSLKAGVVYERPFWREDGKAGRVRSLVGPIGDWHDATPPASLDGDDRASGPGALFGFGPPAAFQGMDRSAAQDAIIQQLVHCFGADAADPIAVGVHDWTADAFTTPKSGSACRGEHPEPVPALARPCWTDRLHFAAAETAQDHPGFLDGAIEAADRVARRLRPANAPAPRSDAS